MFSQRSWGGREMTNNIQAQDAMDHFLVATFGRICAEEGIFLHHVCQQRKSDKETSLQKKNTTLIICEYTRSGLVHIGTSAARSGLVHVLFTFSSWFVQV
jgi:hypothetical protein